MSIQKERYFLADNDIDKCPRDRHSNLKSNEAEESLFVEDFDNEPEMSSTSDMIEVNLGQEAMERDEDVNIQSQKQMQNVQVSFELFSSQVLALLVEVSELNLRSLYEKFKDNANYIELAVNDYLNKDPRSQNATEDIRNNEVNEQRKRISKEPVELQDMYHRIFKESKKIEEDIKSHHWHRFIGSINAGAWATRPTMKPLIYMDKLELRRLVPRNSKLSESAIIRIFTVPKNQRDTSREIGRIPEDLTRILAPLIDLDICVFKATVMLSTERRLSIGDSFYIQIDCFLSNNAFKSSKDFNEIDQMQVFNRNKKQKLDMDVKKENEVESILKLRQYALSRIFDRVGLKPDKYGESNGMEQDVNKSTVAIEISSDSEAEAEIIPESVKSEESPIDELNLDQLKEFYSANNHSSIFSSLPDTTKPPETNFSLNLRQYQSHGLSWMLAREREFDTLENLSATDEENLFSTQLRKKIEDEGLMNPLWRRYTWPKDNSKGSRNEGSEVNEMVFYANMYSGEFSLEKPLIKSRVKGGILADEMGLGKTISCLSLINSAPYDSEYSLSSESSEAYASKTTLVVVPMSLLSQWKKEFDRSNNNSNHKCIIYYGDQAGIDLVPLLCNKKKDIPIVLITTYGTIVSEYLRYSKQKSFLKSYGKMGLFSIKFFRIILDEGHTIRNRNTKTAKAVYELESSRKWVLTGTPVINRLDDLYSIVKFLELDPWSNFSYWKSFITLPFEQRKINKALDVIKSILEPIFLRRTKNTMINGKPIVELPEKEVIIKEIKFNESEERLYNWFKAKASTSFQEGLKSGQLLKRYSQILTHILRLRQVCCHMDLVGRANEMNEDVLETEQRDSTDIATEIEAIIEDESQKGFANKTECHFIMNSLYVKTNPDEAECSICTQYPISISEMAIMPCGHIFCFNCVLDHIDFQLKSEKVPFCPNCREPISKYRIFKVRSKETSRKEIEFYTKTTNNRHFKDYKFQLYHYDPSKTSSKIQALINQLRILKEQTPGEQVIVFSQFSSYLDIIENELKIQGGKGFVIYKFDGRLSMMERQNLLDKFSDVNRNKDKITVLLLSLKAGGTGLNLTTCSTAILMDPWWSPNIEGQAIDRIHRIGQVKNVKVYRFIIENSIETKMLKIQERKKRLGEAVEIEEDERRKRRIEEIQILFEE